MIQCNFPEHCKTIGFGGNIGEDGSGTVHKFIFALDGTNPIDYTVNGNIGVEYSWREIAFLRMGTHLFHDTASYTAGAGVKIGNIHVDYAWASYSILADTHQFGLRFGF